MTEQSKHLIARLERLRDFIENGCSARPQDKGDALRITDDARQFIAALQEQVQRLTEERDREREARERSDRAARKYAEGLDAALSGRVFMAADGTLQPLTIATFADEQLPKVRDLWRQEHERAETAERALEEAQRENARLNALVQSARSIYASPPARNPE